MAVVRTQRYTVDPADLDELLARRVLLFAAVRAGYPGVAEPQLTQLEAGSLADSGDVIAETA